MTDAPRPDELRPDGLRPDGLRPEELRPGALCWVWLDPVVGREQGGRRPAVVISSTAHLDVVRTLVVVVPVTGVDRGWDNHVPVRAGSVAGFAMTEQIRTLSRERVVGVEGQVADEVVQQIRSWVDDFLVARRP